MASPLALRLGTVSGPPGSALPQHVCTEKSSVCQVCLSPHGLAPEGWPCAPDLPRSKPLGDMKWRCRFQPVPGSFGRAGVPGRMGTPTQQQKPWQAHPLSGKPEHRAEGLAAASPAQIRVFSQGSILCAPKLIFGSF